MKIDSKHSTISFHNINIIHRAAQDIINKNPGIYLGNLENYLINNYETSKKETNLCFLELMKEGYYLNPDGLFFPPNQVNQKEKSLLNFVAKKDLLNVDLGILMVLDDLKKSYLEDISLKVVSQYTDYSEKEVRNRINLLIEMDFIIVINSSGPRFLEINWDRINGVDK